MTRRRNALALALPVLTAGAALFPAAAASAETGRFTSSAIGGNEPGGGASGASAEATFRVDSTAGQLCYRVTAEGLETVAAMHIHKGVAGQNGPIVIPLDPKAIGSGEVCTTAAAALLGDVVAQPSGYYLNVHTPQFPAGAVRDQLSPAAPTSVDAGSGGQAGTDGVPVAALGLVALGVVVLGVGGRRLVRP